ncbi:MAG: malonyl-ACP O-methyltransferase BioC [Arenimonas sp.]
MKYFRAPVLFEAVSLRRNFGRAASSYAQVAILQREVENRLIEQLDFLEDRQPLRVLDLGCGPGRASGAMKKRWPKAQVIALDAAFPMLKEVPKQTRFWRPIKRVCADASSLPLIDGSVDVIFSNLCLQWVNDLPATLAEFRRVLKPDGLLLFSTFGPDTLLELREAYWQAGEKNPPLSPFAAIQQIGDAMLAAGFKNPVLDRELYQLTYSDVRSLMKELKAIGANDARPQRSRSLSGKTRLQNMTTAYEKLRVNDVLPSTWEVVTVMAWGPAHGVSRREQGADIASFPADKIPVRKKS